VSTRTAFIGLGITGASMAANLLKAKLMATMLE
jgi:3-hydroxyisobutyrate dehydrogenase-like beta-hydroxyacid dehydrogenase